jgi:tetratricopeptide (TPR) repeat protein
VGRFPRGKLTDLRPLKGLALTFLDCSFNPVHDLTPLQGMALQTLNCDYDAARDAALLQRSRPVLDWRVLGPFPDSASEPFTLPVGSGWSNAEWRKSYRGINEQAVAWQATTAGAQGEVALHSQWGQLNRASAFAYAMVQSPADQEALLLIGSDDGVDLWINGIKVHENRKAVRLWAAVQDRVRVRLKKGGNSVLVRSDNWTGTWMFSVRVPLGISSGSSLDEAWLRETAALPEVQQMPAAVAKVAELATEDAALLLRFGQWFTKKKVWRPAIPFLDRAIALSPTDEKLRRERGTCHVQLAQWDKAAADYNQIWMLHPKDHRMGFTAAFLHARAGNQEAYRRVCARLLEEHGASVNADVAATTALACVLAPQAVADPAAVIRLAQQAVIAQPQVDWHHYALGAAYYRAGRDKEALGSLNRVPTDSKWGDKPLSDLIGAMAHHRLGEAPQARQALEKAVQWYARQQENKALAQRQVFNRDWWELVVFQNLRTEAEELLKDKKP